MAKEQKQPEPAPALDTSEVPGPPKSYRLQIVLALTALVLFETIVLLLLLPTKEQTQARTNGHFTEVITDPPAVRPRDPMVEKPIGSGPIKVRITQNDSNVLISLVMHVHVRKSEEKRFQTRYDQCVQEIIDRVGIILRGATSAERGEVALSTIRERAKREINEVLKTPWIQQVLISEFTEESS